ncbi:acetyl/propionyl/methylcrotonyl-CoA carboxylase subunit alpha [Aestuariirhabdus sp. LZHN29]|uniref:acetyl/propionyl/methylcrotonyl-CoA carboxylase subunit alpha n=1 Tax=Aestuariirhabdus sp. LZHN29 TaxID=3417462 RepID=UPI003CEDA101
MPSIEKLLIANRGEIAVRVLRTAQALGYPTVAVYSDVDRDSLHVQLADEAVCIGAGPVQDSYLNVDNIMQAAQITGANAIHPGYGFLSENSAFARACEQAGLIFIGPSPDAIQLMGSKRLSKIAMIEAGVPTIPGYEGEDQSIETLRSEASKIGYPLMIKASAGGGGRGMRLVTEPTALEDSLKRAASESLAAFGCDELILERAVIAPRHIEIQVFGDHSGDVIHLGERDCSIQRRHQKVVEEAPSPFVDAELRQLMGNAAVQAARACQYVGAGTVEFLVDAERNFYFLEMNTRLQVEHPVTELVTGTDLVAWQLQIAEGMPLPFKQDALNLHGHAIEVRLYAEDPAQQYLPQTGTVARWSPADFEGVRVDHNLQNGSQISPFYDSLQAKVICWGETREIARRRLIRALEKTSLLGVKTNKEYLTNILRHPQFIAANATTAFIGSHFCDDPSLSLAPHSALANALAAALFVSEPRQYANNHCWHSAADAKCRLRLTSGGLEYRLDCTTSDQGAVMVIEHKNSTDQAADDLIRIDQYSVKESAEVEFVSGGRLRRAPFYKQDNKLEFELDGVHYRYENRTHEADRQQKEGAETQVKVPMDGSLSDIMVAIGDQVQCGQSLAIVEAMKMEHPLKAGIDGIVETIRGARGDQVKSRQVLIELSPL